METETYSHSESSSPECPGAPGPKILLTDTNRWPSPARLAMGLAAAGCTVSATCLTRGHPLLHTSVVRETYPYSSLRPLESLIYAIESAKPQIIVPCDDRGVLHLHELYAHALSLGAPGKQLVDLLEYSLGDPASYPVVSGRCELLEIARSEGLRVPETKHVSGIADFKEWQNSHGLPWVLKGDGTFGGRGVRIAHSLPQAQTLFSEIQSMFRVGRALKRAVVNRDPFWLRPWWQGVKPAVIVQSYVVGRPANCAAFCWQGEVKALVGVEVVSSDGMLGPANIVRVIDNSEMKLAADRIARRLKLSGFFGLDFMIEEATGATYLIEMNPRCTPLSHLQLGPGRNLVEAFRAQLLGRPQRDIPPVTEMDLIAYFPQAWHNKSEFLPASFQDFPQGEPELVEALLNPWPDRSFLFRLVSKVSVLKTWA